MKKQVKEIFVADDGKIFESENDCLSHEETARREELMTTYFRVIHSPDLTEGRGHYGLTFLKIKNVNYLPCELAEDFCFRRFGRKVEFTQGCSLIYGWRIKKISKNEFEQDKTGSISVGDYKFPAQVIELKLGEKNAGLIEA